MSMALAKTDDITQTVWYAVHTGPRMEDVADANLRQQGYMTFYPFVRMRQRRKIANRDQFHVEWVNKPYFPRYLFAAIRGPHESIYAINETDGVSTVVYCGDDPLPVPHDVMDELMGRAEHEGKISDIDTLAREKFPEGEQVTFIDESPFAGLMARVAIDSGKAVRVWIEMLSKEQEVSVPPDLLRAVNN